MNAPRMKLIELREDLAVALFIAGAIANVVWIVFTTWMIASGLGRILLVIAERLR